MTQPSTPDDVSRPGASQPSQAKTTIDNFKDKAKQIEVMGQKQADKAAAEPAPNQ